VPRPDWRGWDETLELARRIGEEEVSDSICIQKWGQPADFGDLRGQGGAHSSKSVGSPHFL